MFRKTENETWKPEAKEMEVNDTKILKVNHRDIVRLFSGVITTGDRYIKIKHGKDEVSYQTFLTITNLPEAMAFPGSEWIYKLQQYNFKTEICIHLKNTPYREGMRKLELKKRAVKSQIESVQDANAELPDDVLEAKQYLDLMEAELKNNRYPISRTSITVCLADSNLDELEEKVIKIKQEYEDFHFHVERPLTDQFKLFTQFIPSTGFCIKDFILNLTPQTLSSGIIGATHELGDRFGPYVGTIGVGVIKKYIFLNISLACLNNLSAVATFYGNLGVGKSFNANLILILNIIYGGYGLIFDPKGERTHWQTELTALNGLITIVTLSSDPSFRGKLDPFLIYNDNIEEAGELALNVISELFKISPQDEEYTALLEGIRLIKKEKNPNMLKLADILNSFDKDDDLCHQAKMLSRRMKLQDTGMSRLLFGDGTEEAITLNNRLNILQIQNLKLPSPDTQKKDYTQEETVSTVLMTVMGNFAKKFIHGMPGKFKTVLIDESWALGKTVEGEKLISYMTRMSRSLFSSIILNGHSVLDIPNEGIKNTITYKFCFKTTNDAEIKRMLEYLHLENDKSNIEMIRNLRNGECLFQDMYGHVGKLKFDAVFQDIIDVFSTTPIPKKADEEENEGGENQ